MLNKKLLFLFVVILSVYWILFTPGPKVANDLPITSGESIKAFFSLPKIWTSRDSVGLGEYTVFTLWSWPINAVVGLCALGGLSFSAIEKLLTLLALILSIFGIWKIGERYNLSFIARIVSAAFYVLNTYLLLVIDGGQISIALTYAWFPVAYFLLEKSIYSNLKAKLISGTAVFILGSLDIRFIFLMTLVLIIRFFYELLFLQNKKFLDWFKSWVTLAIIVVFIIVGLNFYWLLPLFLVPLQFDAYRGLIQTSFINSPTLGHAFLMITPHWYKNIFGLISPLKWEFILIPILVFLAPILRYKNYIVGFWVLIALLAIFLTKGSQEPFPQFYPWIFETIPGFSLFRDTTKFYFLIALAYSLLLGITVSEIEKKLKHKRLVNLFVFSIILYFIFLLRPVWLGEMTGTFSLPRYQKEYEELSEALKKDSQFSRVFWIPNRTPLSYTSAIHPAVEASRIYDQRPFASGIVGSYELFNFLREGPFIQEMFNVSGIGYLVYPYLDSLREPSSNNNNTEYYYDFLEQLSNLSWLEKLESVKIPTFKVKNPQSKFFLTSNTWYVIGSDEILNEATKSADLSLSNNALVFLDKHPGLISTLLESSSTLLTLYEKDLTDLTASFISKENLYFPSQALASEPNKNGWWKRESSDFLWWRNFLQQKYKIDNQDYYLGGGLSISEGENELLLTRDKLANGKLLLARVMLSPKSGEMIFYQEDKVIGKVNTYENLGKSYKKITGSKDIPDRVFEYEKANFKWFVIGEINDQPLKIKTSGDINVINALAAINTKDWERYINKAKELEDRNRIIEFKEANTQGAKGKVVYEQVDPTKYKIKVENLDSETMLVFSEKYDPHWKINGKSSVSVYGFLNGFMLTNGEYIVEFEPQKLVYYGFLVSVATLLVILLLLIKLK